MAETRVVDRPERGYFEILVDGQHEGLAAYRRSGERVIFTHTEIEDEGRGLGGVLARQALDEVRARGLTVVPLCPFIRGWIERHPDYADLVVADR